VNQQKISNLRKPGRQSRSEAAKRDLDFTGERIVPQADNCERTFASRMYHEHIARYLFAAQIAKGKSVIDVGCGVGYGSRRLAELGAGSVYALDLSEGAIEHARKHYHHANVQFEPGNAEHFKTEKTFDVAVCFELIEHVRRPRKVLENIKRVLKAEGILLMSTPRALEQKRTHFHEHEFGLQEYVSLISEYFPSVEMFTENNHFSSMITRGAPAELKRVECLKDQFDLAAADAFLAMASRSTSSLPVMEPVLVLDDDAYVRTLEHDVEILHKAEDDLKERIEAIETQRVDELAFKDREIDRLTSDFEVLFADSEKLKSNLWKAERQQTQSAFKDSEIERLTKEYQTLFEQAEELKADLWKARLSEAEAASKGAEVVRLTKEYQAIFDRAEQLKSALWEAEQRASEAASKEAEIVRLTSEREALFAEGENLRAALLEAEQRASEATSKDAEIARLTADSAALREQAENLSDRLRESEMRHAEVQREQQKLRQEIELLNVRSADADARRMEAYEFARTSSNQAMALRRELEIFRRDLASALENPTSITDDSVACDHRHRDIVASMERLFLGTEATHDLARDPLVNRIARLSIELRALQEYQRHAEDWHRQLLTIRKSVSWRITKPLRWATRPFRSRKTS
jgi:2-polyprenyl-3-methyl-5-hydroxy-6-metoxy-1,4-benzoquinol methylase